MRRQKLLKQTILILILFTLICGCSGGGGGVSAPSGSDIPGNSGSVATTPPATASPADDDEDEVTVPAIATIRIEQVLERTVPNRVNEQRFVGLDAEGESTFGPRVLPKTAVIVLQGVPVETTQLQMELLNGTEVVGRAIVPINLVPGETLVLRDIAFEFVSLIFKQVRIAPGSTVLTAGFATNLTATGVYEDDSERDVTGEIEWSTEDELIASVDSLGKLTALRVGNTTITARLGQLSGTADVEVTAAVPVSLRVSPESAQTIDEPVQFEAFVLYSDGSEVNMTAAADWTIDNEDAAQSDGGGLVTPKIVLTAFIPAGLPLRSTVPGVVLVEASLDGMKDASELTINAMDTVTLWLLRGPSVITAPGTSVQYRVTASFSDQPAREITEEMTWSSLSPAEFQSEGNGLFSVGAEVPHGTSVRARGVFGFQSFNVLHYVDRFIFAASFTGGSVRSFQGGENGALDLIESETTDTGARNLVVNPNGRYLYSLNSSGTLGGSVSVCQLSPDGRLGVARELTDDIVPLSGFVTPDGNHLIVCSSTGIYRLNPSFELFSPELITKSTTGAGDIRMDPQGRFLFATSGGEVRVYDLSDPAGPSRLPLIDSKAYASSPNTGLLSVHPSGDYLYAVSTNRDTITSFRVGNDGVLTLLETLPTGDFPAYGASDRSGKYFYLPNLDDTTLSIFEVDTDGTLMPKPGLTVEPGCRSIALDPGGLFAYVTNSTEGVLTSYSVAADGSLTFVDEEAVPGARDVVTTP